MQRIEVPGMGIVEFPDGMSDAQITAAIRQSMASQTPQQEVPGVMQSMMIGAGRAADKVLSGITQMYLGARGEESALRGLAQQEAEKDEAYAPLQQARPIATGVGEALPAFALPIGGGGSILGLAARTGAAAAAPEALKYGSFGERAGRAGVAGIGGAVGGAGGGLLSRALKPAGVGAQAVSDDALAAARRIGFQPTPGQIAQNPAMQNFENYLARSPGSSGRMASLADSNQRAINQAVARALGEKADDVGEATLKAAETRIGGEFTRLQGITAPVLGDDFVNSLASIESANAARGPFRSAKIDDLVNKGLDLAAKNNLSGKAYKEIRSELSSAATTAFKGGDATLGQALKTIRDSLDDAAKASLSKSDQAAWDAARQQWQALKMVTKGNVAEAGNVSAPRLAAVARRDLPGFRTGGAQGPLADVARVGEAFKGAQNPNSGQLMQQMLYGNPLTGLPMMAMNRLSAAAYMNPVMQRYLSQGLLDVGPMGQAALARSGGLLGVPASEELLGTR